jgi:hypothetical protein
MATPQLSKQEIETIRALRHDDELSFEAIGRRLDIDTSTAHRILTKPDYEFTELTLIRIRKGLSRLADQQRSKSSAEPRRAAAR